MDDKRECFRGDQPDPLEESLRLERFLGKYVRGQPKAIDALVKVYEYELTLRKLEERAGPVGVVMFLGPSGVGKTELARRLAQYFTGNIRGMKKINCASYSQAHMIHALIGSPHGYVGYGDAPILSQKSIDEISFLKKKEGDESADPLALEKIELTVKREHIEARLFEVVSRVSQRTDIIEFLEAYNHTLADFLDNFDDPRMGKVMQNDRDYQKNAARLEESLRQISSIIVRATVEISHHIDTIGRMNARLLKIDRRLDQIQIEISDSAEIKAPASSDIRNYFVLLFDEIEKANETLHKLLLEITEDGQVTLANGSVTDLSQAFIILTSNAAGKLIGDVLKGKQKQIGYSGMNSAINNDGDFDKKIEQDDAKILQLAEEELGRTFSPEFRRRIDEVVVCRPLSRKALFEILEGQLDDFMSNMNRLEIALDISEEVKVFIIDKSMHRREVGASLLTHKLRSLIKRPLGRYIAANSGFKGKVRISLAGNALDFKYESSNAKS